MSKSHNNLLLMDGILQLKLPVHSGLFNIATLLVAEREEIALWKLACLFNISPKPVVDGKRIVLLKISCLVNITT